MLLSPEPVRLLGGEQLRDGAVGPGETGGGARIARPLSARADRHQPGFAEHHDVAHVVVRRADQIDDGEGLGPKANRFRAGARLAGAAAGEDQPIDPVARRRRLLGPRPQRPVVKQLDALLLVESAKQLGALGRQEFEQLADIAEHRAAGGMASPASPARCARLAAGLRARAHASDFRAAIMRAAIVLSLVSSRSRAPSS